MRLRASASCGVITVHQAKWEVLASWLGRSPMRIPSPQLTVAAAETPGRRVLPPAKPPRGRFAEPSGQPDWPIASLGGWRPP